MINSQFLKKILKHLKVCREKAFYIMGKSTWNKQKSDIF